MAARFLRVRHRLAAAAASGTLIAAKLPSAACDNDRNTSIEEREVLGAVILFRHGARSAIFSLGDTANSKPPAYDTVHAPPQHAPPIKIANGKNCHAQALPGSPGFLTELGWEQGEALGRHLQRRYGASARISAVLSTDTSRTTLTAHAVLTGFFDKALVSPGSVPTVLPPASIDVIRGAPLAVDIGCNALAADMSDGRAAHRAGDSNNIVARQQFQGLIKTASLLSVLDDCIARRAHGISPSFRIDTSLCDIATREASREVRSALRYGGFKAARLAAGRLCEKTGRFLGDVQCEAQAATARGEAPPAPRLLLLSGHDTSIMGLINAFAAVPSASRKVQASDHTELLPDGTWPPHCSAIAIELLSDGQVRVLYQFEPLFEQPYPAFIKDLTSLSANDEQHDALCGGGAGQGAMFNWAE